MAFLFVPIVPIIPLIPDYMASSPIDTIVALSTPPGIGAIGVIRLSGPGAIAIADKIFAGKNLSEQDTHTLHFGRIIDKHASLNSAKEGEIIDEAVVSLFRNPHS